MKFVTILLGVLLLSSQAMASQVGPTFGQRRWLGERMLLDCRVTKIYKSPFMDELFNMRNGRLQVFLGQVPACPMCPAFKEDLTKLSLGSAWYRRENFRMTVSRNGSSEIFHAEDDVEVLKIVATKNKKGKMTATAWHAFKRKNKKVAKRVLKAQKLANFSCSL